MNEHARPYLKPRTVEGYETLLRRHILPRLGRHKIISISRQDVGGFHQSVGKEFPGAANRALSLLCAILAKGELWGYECSPSRG